MSTICFSKLDENFQIRISELDENFQEERQVSWIIFIQSGIHYFQIKFLKTFLKTVLTCVK